MALPVRLLAVMVIAAVAASCSSTSETAQLDRDPADATVPGHLPTAPPEQDDAEGLTAGANALLAELDQIRQETNLCAILSGAAFEGLVSARIDPAGLVTNPSGLTRLVTAIDATFRHLVEISPPEIAPSMQTVNDVWTRLASIGPAADAEARTEQVLSEPQVVAANQSVVAWAATNCAGSATSG